MGVEVTQTSHGAVFGVKAQPRARREGVAGEWNGCVKITVREPAEGGRANAAIAAVLAEVLRVRPAAVELRSGAASTRKSFAVSSLDAATVRARLERALAPTNPAP